MNASEARLEAEQRRQAQIKPDGVIAHGYVIADDDGRVQVQTFRTNRAECWLALVSSTDRKTAIRRMKRMGFRCVRVWMQEAG